jgi:hypothetical protein
MSFAVFSLVSLLASGVVTEVDLTGWTWEAPVHLPQDATGFMRLALTPDAMDRSRSDFADLRLVSGDKQWAPYVLYHSAIHEFERTTWDSAKLVDIAYEPNIYTRATADFGDANPHNCIQVGLSGKNYRRKVTVEGSADGQTWEKMAGGDEIWLYDTYAQGYNCHMDTASLPAFTFRYLRVTVFNGQADATRIAIRQVGAAQRDVVPAQSIQMPALKIEGPSVDDKTKSSTYEIDLGYRNLPVYKMRFTVADPHFNRPYELRARNSLTEKATRRTDSGNETYEREAPWETVRTGVLCRIPHEYGVYESLEIADLRARYRYYQIQFADKDDAPLNITGVDTFRQNISLVFKAPPTSSTVQLYGGKADAPPPSFDLMYAVVGVVNDDVVAKMPPAELGPLTALMTDPGESLWAKTHPWMIWIPVALAALLLVGLVLMNLRPQKTDPPSIA